MKFLCRIAATCFVVFLGVVAVNAQVIVNENFDSYSDTSAMQAVWTPDGGDGAMPIGQAGEIIPNGDTTNFPFGTNNPPGIMGQGVGNFGSVNEYNGNAYSVFPDTTQNLVVRGDIYIFDDGTEFGAAGTDPADPLGEWEFEPKHNSRQTIGLRNDTVDREITFGFQRGLNFLEMGTWNDTTCDPTISGCNTSGLLTRTEREANPGFIAPTQFGYRMVLFSTYGDMIENGVNKGPILTGPNWQYFALNPALDDPNTAARPNGIVGNNDGTTDIIDIGSGWHTFQATLKDESILLELDLFRDGLDNATGLTGIDASVEIFTGYGATEANPGDSEVPFTSLRIGGPSGVSSLIEDETQNHPGVFDNLYFAVESAGVAGDFDGDGDVDGNDFLLWQRGGSPNPLSSGDLLDWQTNYGAPGLLSTVAAVPEPTSLTLLVVATALFSARRRR